MVTMAENGAISRQLGDFLISQNYNTEQRSLNMFSVYMTMQWFYMKYNSQTSSYKFSHKPSSNHVYVTLQVTPCTHFPFPLSHPFC